MKYMLDTNIIVYIRNNRPAEVFSRFRQYSPEDLCISAITMAELEYGACNSSDPLRNRLALLTFLSTIRILPFDAEASADYGQIRYYLKTKGEPIGSNDLLIAAHARSAGLTLVTNNTKEFKKVPGLEIVNWV
ncbi:MAG: type II toxin-antitoxin system VapC family toxin [Lachnospiraceae bacterium]|nr:type II toxin-antitoxin system VapC family toxin [Lachnospiraceae bacterium]